jgi:hydroxypyruvate isomerase
MPTFSANLGFLWTEIPLADAIVCAKRAGFDAVECHFPYDEPIDDVKAALKETSLPMLGINTIKGRGGAGLSALPGHESTAREAIDQAFAYGIEIGAFNVHVMAGKAEGEEAERTYLHNLNYAANLANNAQMTVLIEPLNAFDMPNYFLRNTSHAIDLIEKLSNENIKLMFDCYHVGRTEGNVIGRFNACLSYIGHIQFASVPDRREPDQGTLDYAEVFRVIDESGWSTPLGAEYKPASRTDQSLDWMQTLPIQKKYILETKNAHRDTR